MSRAVPPPPTSKPVLKAKVHLDLADSLLSWVCVGKAEHRAIGSLIHTERKSTYTVYCAHWTELVNLLMEALTADILKWNICCSKAEKKCSKITLKAAQFLCVIICSCWSKYAKYIETFSHNTIQHNTITNYSHKIISLHIYVAHNV